MGSTALFFGNRQPERSYVDAAWTQAPADEPIRTAPTPREAEVWAMLARGAANKDIARRMGITTETVKEHIRHLRRKMGVCNRIELAIMCYGERPWSWDS